MQTSLTLLTLGTQYILCVPLTAVQSWPTETYIYSLNDMKTQNESFNGWEGVNKDGQPLDSHWTATGQNEGLDYHISTVATTGRFNQGGIPLWVVYSLQGLICANWVKVYL